MTKIPNYQTDNETKDHSSVEQQVDDAIDESKRTRETVEIPWSDSAVSRLFENCDRDSKTETTHLFRGADIDGVKWSVRLTK